MKKFRIEVSQNGWEYIGLTYVTANEVKKKDNYTIVADGMTIEFDEEVGDITEIRL